MFGKIKQSIVFWIAHRLPPCDVVIKQLSDSLDRKLPLRDRIKIKLHLMVCVWCVRYGEQIQFVRTAARNLGHLHDQGEAAPKRRLSSAARERLKKTLDENNETSISL